MFEVSTKDNDIIIRFDRSLIDYETLDRFLDYLRFMSIKKKGADLSQEQIDALAKEVDARVWEQVKHKIGRAN